MVGRIYRKKQSGLLVRDSRHSKIFFITEGKGVFRGKVLVQKTERRLDCTLNTGYVINVQDTSG